MYYCAGCNKAIDPMAYAALTKNVDNYYDGSIACPTRGCESAIIDIDENLIPLMHSLYELGVKTMFCCSGHPWELEDKNAYIYFVYDYDPQPWKFDYEVDFVEEFTNQLLKLQTEKKYSFLHVTVSEVPEHQPDRKYNDLGGCEFETRKIVDVHADRPKYSKRSNLLQQHKALLKAQFDFIDVIDVAIGRTFKALSERSKGE